MGLIIQNSLRIRPPFGLLKIPRTIADLDHADRITAKYLAEAVQCRSLDRNYWQ